jgi:medium-chain acyl-[acyl-carrier-protein] hydrolase
MSGPSRHQSWIDVAPLPSGPPRVRLFCFPYAGAGPSIFRSWQADVLDGIQICTVHLPGRGDRFGEPPFTRLAPLIDALAESIRPFLDVPVAFFGHCMGALIGFELARRLRDEGCEPIHLVVSALPGPSLLGETRPLYDLPEADFVSSLTALNGIPSEMLEHRDLLDAMLPTLRADFELCETYRYRAEPPLQCRLSAYCGGRDPRCQTSLVDSWRAETVGKFSSRFFPGDHFFIDSARAAVLSAISIDLLGALYTQRSRASA